MPSGRRVRLVGKAMIINLNNKGGVRKAKKITKFNTCVGLALSGKKYTSRALQRAGFTKAAQGCKGK